MPAPNSITVATAIPEGNVDVSRWWKYKNLRTLNLLMVIPLLSLFIQGFDGSMMNGLQSVEGWRTYFGEPKGATLGLFNAAYPIGGLVATPFISFVNDGFGRRVGLATAPLLTEVAHPAHRATATALFNTTYALGAIIAAWTTFGTFRIDGSAPWRIPSALQGLPSVLQLLGLYLIPESPRWLISKDRGEKALHILAKYHAEGDANDPLVQFEYNEINETLAYERSTSKASWIQGYLEFTRSAGNRKRLFILLWSACFAQMSGNAFISYYLAPILTSVGLTSSLEQTLINATQQILSWLSALYFATLPQKLSRRVLLLGSGVAIFLCLVGITTGSAIFAKYSSNKAAAGATVAFLYLFSPAYNFDINGNLGLYIAEILPFHIRMRGQACYQFFATCFTLLSTYAFPSIVVEFVVVYLVYPETKGFALEEIVTLFDGERLAAPVDEKRDKDAIDVEHAEIRD
ncbi:hexose transporter protein [Aspergillus crustosus]